jgi:hypothetical protein
MNDSSPNLPVAPSTAHDLVGTWRLRSFEMRDEHGNIAYPFGHETGGFITYTTDGRMSVQFGNAQRADLRYDDWLGATVEEIERSARGFFAYCGTYEIRGNQVIHRIEWSLMPNWIGGEQQRFWELDGNTLSITTPPLRLEGRPQVSALVWERL